MEKELNLISKQPWDHSVCRPLYLTHTQHHFQPTFPLNAQLLHFTWHPSPASPCHNPPVNLVQKPHDQHEESSRSSQSHDRDGEVLKVLVQNLWRTHRHRGKTWDSEMVKRSIYLKENMCVYINIYINTHAHILFLSYFTLRAISNKDHLDRHRTNLVREKHKLTIYFEDEAAVFAASCRFCDSDDVVSCVLQPQVWQAHGAIVVGLHSAAVIHSYVGVNPWLPCPYGAADHTWHKVPFYGGDPTAGNVHWEKDVLLHWSGEASLGTVDGDGSSFRGREKKRVKKNERLNTVDIEESNKNTYDCNNNDLYIKHVEKSTSQSSVAFIKVNVCVY